MYQIVPNDEKLNTVSSKAQLENGNILSKFVALILGLGLKNHPESFWNKEGMIARQSKPCLILNL